jgi:hypothetical protein
MSKKKEPLRVTVIGLGGTGGWVVTPLATYLNNEVKIGTYPAVELTLIDGDKYEPKNKARQVFSDLGNKAAVTADRIAADLDELLVTAVKEYVTPKNITRLVTEGQIILSCVDNHNSRKMLSRHCSRLENVTLISGGNDGVEPEKGTDGLSGNIQVYTRQAGKDVTLPLDNKFHPEIDTPTDTNPGLNGQNQYGCVVRQSTSPQIVFANFMVADMMLRAFYASISGGVSYDEVYGNVTRNSSRAVTRRETKEK